VQRGGPSTGLPTKTEQADLLQALFGRHGECPLPVLAPASPADSFLVAYEAARLAIHYMTPVVVLSEVDIAHGAEPWKIPAPAELPAISVRQATPSGVDNGTTFHPYQRDAKLVRPWAVPGTPTLEHRLGGLEKEDRTGHVSYDPVNHERMVELRARKIANISQEVPPLTVSGPEDGDLLVIGWGGTFGAITAAADRARNKGLRVASAHLRHLHPLPANTGEILRRYRKILVPELNSGQLLWLLRGRFLVDAVGCHKVQGRPFLIREIEAKIEEMLQQTVPVPHGTGVGTGRHS
jgi:2-oxoglutarate ferredoxin oxidoreductase subunit alpha